MAKRHVRELVGFVLSDKVDKTVIVEVTRLMQHRLYKKVIKRRKRFTAHDEKNTAKIGDEVRIRETKPISKTKRWRVSEVLRKQAI